MQKGYQDRIELARQQELDQQRAEEHNQALQSHKLANAISAQSAATNYGLFANDPAALEAAGGNMVPMGGSQPAPYQAPDLSRGPSSIAPNSPLAATANVEQNDQLNHLHQQALTSLITQHANNPQLVQGNAQQGVTWVHPMLAAQAQEAAKATLKHQQEMELAQENNDSKEERARTYANRPGRLSSSDRWAEIGYKGAQSELSKLESNPIPSADTKTRIQQLRADIQDYKDKHPEVGGDPEEENIWQSWLKKHPSTKKTPENRAKVIKALKGK